MRVPAAFVIALSIALFLPTATARALAGETSISGGRLPHPVRFSSIDEAALARRVNSPPRLDKQPDAGGTSYILDSPYWATVLPLSSKEPTAAERGAEYFPNGGFVRARQGGKDAWLVLDLRQRAIIDRYIRLGEKVLLSSAPGELDVLRAAAGEGEVIGIQVGAEALDPIQAQAFWTAVRSVGAPVAAVAPPSPGVDDVPLVFTLPEGRSVEMRYLPASKSLVDLQGFESYSLDAATVQLLSSAQTARPSLTPQESSPGSPLWWPVGLGLGVAVIFAAVWLQRRFSAARP